MPNLEQDSSAVHVFSGCLFSHFSYCISLVVCLLKIRAHGYKDSHIADIILHEIRAISLVLS
jgi:hypothetical protein